MTRTSTFIVVAGVIALAGCKKHTIVAGPPIDYDSNKPKAVVPLPPSVTSSKSYRCADDKIVYVDWLSDNKSANLRTEKAGSPTQVTASEAGKPMAGPTGYSLEGKASDASIKVALPGHPSQSCKG